MDTARGPEYGYCTGGNHKIPQKEVVAPLRQVIRLATEADEKIAEENYERELENNLFAMIKEKEQTDGRLLMIEIVTGIVAIIPLLAAAIFTSLIPMQEWQCRDC